MISYINFGVLIISSILFTYFYFLSVSPAAMEKKIGSKAYRRCGMYRVVSSIFMFISAINYIFYYTFPLPLSIPHAFPWPWWVSAIIAFVIAIPSGWLMLRGVKDAGEETMRPRPEHTLYSGIYQRVRHPQAVGEFPIWWVLAFLVHSPFLVLFTFLYIPIWYLMCVMEEKDLLLRYGKAYEEYRKKTGFWFPRRKKGEVRARHDE